MAMVYKTNEKSKKIDELPFEIIGASLGGLGLGVDDTCVSSIKAEEAADGWSNQAEGQVVGRWR